MISIWGLIVLQLSTTWNTNEQYAHGFLVPFLCFYLLLKSEPFIGNQESKKSLLQGKTWYLIGIPLLLSLIPLWTIRGANSDWRLLNFVLFGIVSFLPYSLLRSGWMEQDKKSSFSIALLYSSDPLAVGDRFTTHSVVSGKSIFHHCGYSSST